MVASLLLFEELPTSNAPRQATQHAKFEQYRASIQRNVAHHHVAVTNQPSSRTGESGKALLPALTHTTAIFLWGFGRRGAEENLQTGGRGTGKLRACSVLTKMDVRLGLFLGDSSDNITREGDPG